MSEKHAPIPRDLQGLWEDLKADEGDWHSHTVDMTPGEVCAFVERIAQAEQRAAKAEAERDELREEARIRDNHDLAVIDQRDDAIEAAASEKARADRLEAALLRAERKLAAYVGICKGDKELTDTVLPMAREALRREEEQS